jgi:hypothetical protein
MYDTAGQPTDALGPRVALRFPRTPRPFETLQATNVPVTMEVLREERLKFTSLWTEREGGIEMSDRSSFDSGECRVYPKDKFTLASYYFYGTP